MGVQGISCKCVVEWTNTYSMHDQRVFRSCYRKLFWVAFESTTADNIYMYIYKHIYTYIYIYISIYIYIYIYVNTCIRIDTYGILLKIRKSWILFILNKLFLIYFVIFQKRSILSYVYFLCLFVQCLETYERQREIYFSQ